MMNFKFKELDTLVILDRYLRETAPVGRNRLQIKAIRRDGWVDIKYEDGTRDSLTYGLLETHWGYSPGQNTKLWKLLNE